MGSANMAEKVRLQSSDGRLFEADVEAVMFESVLLKNLIEDMGTDAVIPVPEVPGDILKLVIEYCEARYRFGFNFTRFDPVYLLQRNVKRFHDLTDMRYKPLDVYKILDNEYDEMLFDTFIISESTGLQVIDDDETSWEQKDHEFDITRSGREILGDKRRWHAGKEHRAGIINVNDLETHEDERSWEEKDHDASFVNQVCSKFDWDTIKGLHEAAKFLDINSLLFLTSTLISQAPSRAFLGVVSPWLDCDGLEEYRKLEMERHSKLEVLVF